MVGYTMCLYDGTQWHSVCREEEGFKNRSLRNRAVVLESGLGLESGLEKFFYRLGLVLDSLVFGLGLVSDLVIGLAKCSSWSRLSPAIYAFFLFQNKDSLVPQMGNVMAIGLTPSRTGIVIGPSRTGIVIGPSRTGIVIGPSRTGIVIGHRHAVGKLHNTVWLYKVRWSFPSHFPSLSHTLLMPVRILLSLSFQVNFLSITYNDTFSAINMGL